MMIAGYRASLRLLWQYLAPFRRRVILLSLLLIGGIGLQLLAPQVIRRFLDQAVAGQPAPALLATAGLFFFVVFSQKVVSLSGVYVGEDLGWAATNRLRADLAAHVLRLDMGFHKLRTPGELIERIDGDVGLLAENFSQLVGQVVANSLLICGVLLLLFLEAWPFGLVGLGYCLATLFFLRAIGPPQSAIWGRIRQGFAELFSYIEERLGGTEDIRANGAEAYVLHGLYPLMAHVNAQRAREVLFGGLTFSTGYMLHILAWVITLGLAAGAYRRGELTIGTVYLLAFYVVLLEGPLKFIRRQVQNLQRAMASIGRINEFFELSPAVVERPSAHLPAATPTLTFERVSFAYKDRPAASDQNGSDSEQAIVLHDIGFTLPAGRLLGLLGRTGSGKTTLTRLLFRLYDVDEGRITLDGVDVRDVALSELRQRVAMVTQEVQLFAASVRDNLTLFHNFAPGQPPVDDATIHAALAELGLEEWLSSLPDGLDTLLGAGGQSLSAGEAQLLALARVLLRDPQLVILDEASSRLDPATEQRLERALDRLLAGRTGIIIAHRLATVQRADEILILEQGRLVEHGERQALAADPSSRFAGLLRTNLVEVLA